MGFEVWTGDIIWGASEITGNFLFLDLHGDFESMAFCVCILFYNKKGEVKIK